MVNFEILLMPFTFLYIATGFFFLLLLLNALLKAKNCVSKGSCHWHTPVYFCLFSLWQDETTKVFFCNQTGKCERSLQNTQCDMYLYTKSIYFQGASFSDEGIPLASLYPVGTVIDASPPWHTLLSSFISGDCCSCLWFWHPLLLFME